MCNISHCSNVVSVYILFMYSKLRNYFKNTVDSLFLSLYDSNNLLKQEAASYTSIAEIIVHPLVPLLGVSVVEK